MTRVCRTKSWLKVFSLVFFALSLCFGFGVLRGVVTEANSWLELAIAAVLFLVGLGSAIQNFTSCLVLQEDTIRYKSIFRSRSMRLDQIRYGRAYEEYQDAAEGGVNVSYLEFVPRYGDTGSFKFRKDDFELDRDFQEWVLRIPELEDLDAPI